MIPNPIFMPHILRLILIIGLSASCFAQELLRPTTDSDAGNNLTLGCNGTNQGSSSLPLGRDNAGITTSSNLLATGTKTSTFFKTRFFSAWQTTPNGYTALTLNVNWSASELSPSGNSGQACTSYSLNNGGTYTSIGCTGGGNQTQKTSSVNIDPTTPLGSIRVAVCVKAAAGLFTSGNSDNITVFDVWTVGTLSGGQGGGPGSTKGQAQRGAIIIN